jgi:AcrR family transcriptional regulator
MATRETQSRILDAAIALFNEHGTAAVSTNRIAEACGISKGNLHYHFKTKREIVLEIFRRIVAEMDSGWYQDHLQPTIRHMAEMFARQVLLIYEYRFFYREMPALLRDDPQLMERNRRNRERRMGALEGFFLELDRNDALQLDGDRHLIRSLVHSTWIISDNWLNSQEFAGRLLDEASVLDGYHLILDILRPYFVGDQDSIVAESRSAICRHLRQRGIASGSPDAASAETAPDEHNPRAAGA